MALGGIAMEGERGKREKIGLGLDPLGFNKTRENRISLLKILFEIINHLIYFN